MKKVLVTGGAGFIGKHTVMLLEKKGYEVITLDYDDRKLRDSSCLHKICGSITNQPLLSALLQEYKPEGIIHLAAQSSVEVSMRDWRYDAEQNIIGTINLMQEAKLNGVERIVYASSAGACYGNARKLPINEDAAMHPISAYGISKMAAEYYVQLSGIPFAILRYPNVYGPGQDPNGSAGVVAIFIKTMMMNEQCKIYGDGEQAKDYVYVEDIARSNVMALESDSNGIYNLGAGKATSVNMIHSFIARQLNSQKRPQYMEAREGDVRRFYLDATEAERILDWKPTIALEEGIRRTIEYMMRGGRKVESSVSCAEGAGSIPAPAIK